MGPTGLGFWAETETQEGERAFPTATSVLGPGALGCLAAVGCWEHPDSCASRRPVLPGELPSAHIYPTLEQPCLGQLQTQTHPQWVRRDSVTYVQLLLCTDRNTKVQVGEVTFPRSNNKHSFTGIGNLGSCLRSWRFSSLARNGNWRSRPVWFFWRSLITMQLDLTWIQAFADRVH